MAGRALHPQGRGGPRQAGLLRYLAPLPGPGGASPPQDSKGVPHKPPEKRRFALSTGFLPNIESPRSKGIFPLVVLSFLRQTPIWNLTLMEFRYNGLMVTAQSDGSQSPKDVVEQSAILEKEKTMSKKLYVGGLAWGTDENGLREAFEQYGEVVDCKIITDRDTGRSRGFGFVTLNEGNDALLHVFEGDRAQGRRTVPECHHGAY